MNREAGDISRFVYSNRAIRGDAGLDLGALVVRLQTEHLKPVAAAELECPRYEADVLGERVAALGGVLPQQAKLLLQYLGSDAVTRAAVDKPDEGNAFLRESLLDE